MPLSLDLHVSAQTLLRCTLQIIEEVLTARCWAGKNGPLATLALM